MNADSRLCPENVRQSLRMYVDYGCPPGSFLTAVLDNDLLRAFGAADEDTQAAMPHIVAYVYNELRGDCWGSPEKRRAWMASFSRAAVGEEKG